MPDCSPSAAQNGADMVLLNQKLQYDSAAQIQHQSLIDNQAHARALQAIQLRRAENAATVDHFANLGLLQLTQTGATENQASVSPIRTAAGDAITGGVGVSAEQVAANVANLASSLTPIIATALATALSQTLAAVLPAVITSAGIPTQTQPSATA